MRSCWYEKRLSGLYKPIIESICEIEEFTRSVSYEDFLRNKMAIKAVSMNLILIGENVRLVPVEIRKKYRQVPWVRMKSARNFIAHEYPKVEFKEMWDTAKFELPAIKVILEKILEKE
jgi:uncharacterized protein with HEPN domain